MTSSTPVGSPSDDDRPPLRVAYVAMKPMLRGRIRRNIMTLLELGAEVTIVNTPPRDDFYQGLDSPRLTADFVEVRSAAVRYQAWMSRQNARRKQRWERERAAREALAEQERLAKEERRRQARAERAAAKRAEAKRARAAAAQQSGVDTDVRPPPVAAALPPTKAAATTRRSSSGPRRGSSATLKRWRKQVRRGWRDNRRKVVRQGRALRQKRDLTVRDGLKKFHLINRFFEFWRLSPDRIAALEPDLIVSSDLPGLVGASIAARRLGRPHLHDCHELYLESTTLKPHERVILQPFEKRYMRRADRIVVVNQTIRDEYERRYGVRGTVLRNCAPAVAADVRAEPIDIRGLAGLAPEGRVVLYQGGLMAGRGLDVCVRAVAHFPPGAHLVIVGSGSIKDELVALVDEAGVGDRVHWLPAVTPAELPAYTVAADIGLIPYQPVSKNNQYALPNKVFEYTGAGVPFVAADLPELRRITENARCGEVYDPYEPAGLGAAVATVLDPDRHAAYREAAERFGRENTWESEREILITQVRDLVGAGRV